ncbi:inhibitor of growth 3-like, partial [Paramuricea clavata]
MRSSLNFLQNFHTKELLMFFQLFRFSVQSSESTCNGTSGDPPKTTWRRFQNKEENKIGRRFFTKMHYLEDFLELIEQLPIDLRDRYTEMREMDLQVQNAIDDLDLKGKDFFSSGATATQEWKEENYKNLKQEYSKALEDAEEKVNIATQIYDLVDRHLRKLDQELSKFKMELEADNAGITEVLEQ